MIVLRTYVRNVYRALAFAATAPLTKNYTTSPPSALTTYLLQHAQQVRVKLGHACPLIVVRQEPDPGPVLERVEQREIRLIRGDIYYLVFRQMALSAQKKQYNRRHETEPSSLQIQYQFSRLMPAYIPEQTPETLL